MFLQQSAAPVQSSIANLKQKMLSSQLSEVIWKVNDIFFWSLRKHFQTKTVAAPQKGETYPDVVQLKKKGTYSIVVRRLWIALIFKYSDRESIKNCEVHAMVVINGPFLNCNNSSPLNWITLGIYRSKDGRKTIWHWKNIVGAVMLCRKLVAYRFRTMFMKALLLFYLTHMETALLKLGFV